MNAILMASGLGTRMRPLTLTKPKPLIAARGVPMIETVINALKKAGTERLFVVVGYLGEQFSYLTEKYEGVSIIKNPDYETANNISSVFAAADVLETGDCFICESDLFIPDAEVLEEIPEFSCYYGKFVAGYSEDWVFDTDENGFITRVGKGGEDRFNMCGISFFKKKDAALLAKFMKNEYKSDSGLFWDEVVNAHLDELRLRVREISPEKIVEIDTPEELEAINN